MTSMSAELEDLVAAGKAYGDARAADQKALDDAATAAVLAERDSTIAALRAKLAAAGAGGPLFGMNYAARVVTTGYGPRPKVARIFYQDNLAKSKLQGDAGFDKAYAAGVRVFVTSHKDTNLKRVATLLAAKPVDCTVYTCFNHEGEDDARKVVNGKTVPALPGDPEYDDRVEWWHARWAEQSPVIREAGCIPTQIDMAWTLDPGSGRNPTDWMLRSDLVDVRAWDAYLDRITPALQVSRMIAATKAAGSTRMAVAETGSAASDPKQAAKLADLRARLIAADATPGFDVDFACGWSAKDATNGWDGQFSAASLDAWLGAAA